MAAAVPGRPASPGSYQGMINPVLSLSNNLRIIRSFAMIIEDIFSEQLTFLTKIHRLGFLKMGRQP
jgi:hypothetical protein